MDDETPSNVVALQLPRPSARLKRLDFTDPRARCQHEKVEIWPNQPRIECKACGALVDPYDWLRKHCREWQRMEDDLEAERQNVRDEIEELKKARRLLRQEYADEVEKRRTERAIMVLPPHVRPRR